MKDEVIILEVVEITQGGNNAWVITNIGKLKKPLNAIPKRLLDKYKEGK